MNEGFRRTLRIVLALLAAATLSSRAEAESEHRIGFGVHYWQTMDDLADIVVGDDIDETGLSGVLSYQYVAGLMRFELAAEYFEAGFQGAEDWAIAPQAYVLVGRGFYGGIGAGVTYANFREGSWSDPYFISKVGIDLLLLPKIHLDINADYRFTEWDEIYDYDTDTITFGATVRFSF